MAIQWRSRAGRTLTVFLLVTPWHWACMGWHTTGPTPEAALQTKHRNSVRVTLEDGTRQVVKQPEVQGDSILSRTTPGVGVPLARIRKVEVRRAQPVQTTLMLAGTLYGLVGASCAAGCLNWHWKADPQPDPEDQ